MWKIAVFLFFLAIIWQVVQKFLKLRRIERYELRVEKRRAKPPFEEIWLRIITNAGQTFYTKSNMGFTYKVIGDVLHLSTSHKIYKEDFKKAYNWFPADDPANIHEEVKGLSYVWAILHDQRIFMW